MQFIGDAVDGLGSLLKGLEHVAEGLEANEDWWLVVLYIGDAVDGWDLK